MNQAPCAIVMHMFYTGLGIARSLGERGVRVIGLTSKRGVYGSFTRYAKVLSAPDSRDEPEALLKFLLNLGKELGTSAVIFPTRDDDLVFLSRFRSELEAYFRLVVPEETVLDACLNKWTTYQMAQQAKVPAPKSWLIEGKADLQRVIAEVTYPCVLKAVAAYHWRQGHNWEIVGGRKAIGIFNERDLLAEYQAISSADHRALLQEMVPGGDEGLVIVACYLDRASRWVAGFNTQKVLQIPEGFGTGCIVQSVSRPELFEPTRRLLESMHFAGIAEVEYKWDAATGEYKLIEINPRPWDQHRLGNAAGVDLMYVAYCELAGLPLPQLGQPVPGHKWIAEDSFATTAIRSLFGTGPNTRTLFGLARGNRIYGIWWGKDPLPALVYWITFIPKLTVAGFRAVWSAFKSRLSGEELVYDTHVKKPESLS